MGPIIRIAARYLIGYLGAAGIIPDGLAEMITEDDAAIGAIETGLCVGAGVCVEVIYQRAKRFGWRL
jgi:hypothetical protein